jgi:hypothetical protein
MRSHETNPSPTPPKKELISLNLRYTAYTKKTIEGFELIGFLFVLICTTTGMHY